MRDPERLSSGYGVTDFERELIDAAKSEPLPDHLRAGMERALGLTIGVGAGAVGASALAGVRGLGLKAAAVKASTLLWVSAGVVALGVAGGMLGARIVGQGVPTPAASRAGVKVLAAAEAAPAAPRRVERALAPAPAPAVGLARAGNRARTVAAHDARRGGERVTARRDPPPAGDELRAEIALIDAARQALRVGSPARALEILAGYTARFPGGVLDPESVALRVEALAKAGQTHQAQALARRFVAANPASPLAERMQRLASGSASP